MDAKGALWKGSIRFGLFAVPVKLHTAARESRVHFHLLHKTDGERLHQVMVCGLDDRPVPPEEQVKGYEVAEGRYVLVEPEELAALDPEPSRAIEVREFVPGAQVDPFLIDHVYTLLPDGGYGFGELLAALDETGMAGICAWTMRKRAYVGCLEARGGSLRLAALRHADEVVGASTLGLAQLPVTEKELRIGCDLIGMLAAPFSPQKYQDEHQRRLKELIQAKADGQAPVLQRPRVLHPTPPDGLMAALEASLRKVA